MEQTIERDILHIKARKLDITGGDITISAQNSLNLPPPNLSPVGDLTLHPTQDLHLEAGRDILSQSTRNTTLSSAHNFDIVAQEQINIQSLTNMILQSINDISLSASHGVSVHADQDLILDVDRDVRIHADRDVTVSSTQTLELTGSTSATLGGPVIHVNATSNLDLTSANILVTATNDLALGATNNINIGAGAALTSPIGMTWMGSFEKLVTPTGGVGTINAAFQNDTKYSICITRILGTQYLLSITKATNLDVITTSPGGTQIFFNFVPPAEFSPFQSTEFLCYGELNPAPSGTPVDLLVKFLNSGVIQLVRKDGAAFLTGQTLRFRSAFAIFNKNV